MKIWRSATLAPTGGLLAAVGVGVIDSITKGGLHHAESDCVGVPARNPHNLIRSPDSLLEFLMARPTPLEPSADQGTYADWESVEHEWSILAMVPSIDHLSGPAPFGSRTPVTVKSPHHAILIYFAKSSSEVEEVLPDCGSE